MNDDRLIVGTRKGLFVFEADDADPRRWRQTALHFIGEPVTSALADRRDGTLYAALNLGHFGVKLHRLPAGEHEWQQLEHYIGMWHDLMRGNYDWHIFMYEDGGRYIREDLGNTSYLEHVPVRADA